MDHAPTNAELADQVLAYAREHTAEPGWSVLVETITPRELVILLDEAQIPADVDPDATESVLSVPGSGGEPTFEGALEFIRRQYISVWAGHQTEAVVSAAAFEAPECAWAVGDDIEHTSKAGDAGSRSFRERAVVTQVLAPTMVAIQIVNGPRQDFEFNLSTEGDWTRVEKPFQVGDVVCSASLPMDGETRLFEVLACGLTHMQVKDLNGEFVGEVSSVGVEGWQKYVPAPVVQPEACQESRPHLAHQFTVLLDTEGAQQPYDCPGVTFPAEIEPPLHPQLSTRELLIITAQGYGWTLMNPENTQTLIFDRRSPVQGHEVMSCRFLDDQAPDRLTEVAYFDSHKTRSWSPSNPSYTRREWALHYLTH